MSGLPPCAHCGLPIPPQDLVTDEIDGRERAFCCHGCRGAYRIITGAGLGAFYDNRSWDEPGVPDGAFETAYDRAYLERFVRQAPGGSAEVDVLVDGVRCAACVWLIEKLVGELPGVHGVRVNFATHRARIRFAPDETPVDRVFDAVARLGYLPRPYTAGEAERQARRDRRRLLVRFGTAAFLSMQLMGYSIALYAGYFHGIDPDSRWLLQVLAGAVATPVVFYSGWPFLQGAWRSMANRAPDMDLLVAVGVLSAWGYSVYAVRSGQEVYFDSAAMIVTLILLGRLFEAGARGRASAGIDRLLRLAPDTAHRQRDGRLEDVDAAALAPGDRIQVRPGERFPVDGKVLAGHTEIDASAATGEPDPVSAGPGDPVLSGTLNLTASVTVRATATAAGSFIGRVARLVEEAQARRAPVQAVADRVAARFVPAVGMTAAATFAYWHLAGAGTGTALLRAVAVLVVACPCALGLATPLAILVGTGAAARRGVLFRGGDVLEALGRVSRAGFDKTGTLTRGWPRVVAVRPARDRTEAELLAAAARVESASAHPLSRAVLDEARARGIDPGPAPAGVAARPGLGVAAEVNGQAVRVGSRAFLEQAGIAVPPKGEGRCTEVHVAAGSAYLGALALEDQIRPGAREAVAALAARGIAPALLTGDRPGPARRVAAAVGIGEVHAELTPEGKTRWVRERQKAGERVLLVGDGINDAPALSAADVGCALAGGTDIALETSDLVLTRPDLGRLVLAVAVARRTLVVVRQNLGWAFAYNAVAIPLAATGRLAPVWAAAAMAGSSLAVLANSLRLRRLREEPGPRPGVPRDGGPAHEVERKRGPTMERGRSRNRNSGNGAREKIFRR